MYVQNHVSLKDLPEVLCGALSGQYFVCAHILAWFTDKYKYYIRSFQTNTALEGA